MKTLIIPALNLGVLFRFFFVWKRGRICAAGQDGCMIGGLPFLSFCFLRMAKVIKCVASKDHMEK